MDPRKERVRRLLVILQHDMNTLHDRLVHRKDEYLSILSLQRNRKHFEVIFRSRYPSINVDTLMMLTEDVLVLINNFYTAVERYEWYLMHTEDQPSVVEGASHQYIKEISSHYQTLSVFLDAELSTIIEKAS